MKVGSIFSPLVYSFLLLLSSTSLSFASSSLTENWLESVQRQDGLFANELDLALPYQGTSEALQALRLRGIETSADLQLASRSLLLASEDSTNTEVLARAILANENQAEYVSQLLVQLYQRQTAEGGFSAYPGFDSDLNSTAYALRAMSAVDSGSSQAAYAVGYALSTQNSDGGWTLGLSSSVPVTAEIVLALNSFRRFQGVSGAIAEGTRFITLRKQSDSLWGTTADSALALSALTLSVSSSAELISSAESLQARMEDDGSWDQDVYTTALVLQAFRRVNGVARDTVRVGSVNGRVHLLGSSEPIMDAVVTVAGTRLQTKTDAQGRFHFANIPAGGQTVLIEKSGYMSVSSAVVIQQSSNSDVGSIYLAQSGSGAFVQGRLYDARTLVTISSASVTLKSPTASEQTHTRDGHLEFVGLEAGDYTFSIQAAGYHTVSGGFSISAGQSVQLNQAMVNLATPLVDDPLQLTGVMVDGETKTALAGAQMKIGGATVITDANGNFTTPVVERGTHRLVAELEGYNTRTFELNIPAGASGGLGILSLYQLSLKPSVTDLDVFVTVIDKVSGAAIAGAQVSVPSQAITGVSGTDGSLALMDLTSLEFLVGAEAEGYLPQQWAVTASAFGSTALTFALTPEAEDNGAYSLSGTVIDSITDQAIAGATISTSDGAVAITSAAGFYFLADLPTQEVKIEISADGYAFEKRLLQLGATRGNYSTDLFLTPSIASTTLDVLNVSINSVVEPDATAIVQIDVKNHTQETQTGILIVRVIDSVGEEIATLVPSREKGSVEKADIELAPGEIAQFKADWPVGQAAASSYLIRAEVVEPGSISREIPRGNVISLAIAHTEVVGGSKFAGAIDVNPPLIQAGTSAPVSLMAVIRSSGNQPLSAGEYTLEIAGPESSEPLHSVVKFADELAQNEVIHLDFGSWLPPSGISGELTITVSRAESDFGKIYGSLYIGDVASANFTVSQQVLPEGNSDIRGRIEIRGVDTTLGSSVDPLFVLVKDAIEAGASYVGPQAIAWDKRNNCMGCHTQAQSLTGLSSSLEKAAINEQHANYLFNMMTTIQRPNGSLENSHPGFSKTATLFGAWSLTDWPKPEQSFKTLIKALENLWGQRSTSSGRTYWVQDHNTGWLNNPSTATALSVLIAARTMDLRDNAAFVPSQPVLGSPISMGAGNAQEHTFLSAEDGLYVGKFGGTVVRIDTENNTSRTLFTSVPGLSGRVNGVEKDSAGNLWLSSQQGELIQVTQQGAVLQRFRVCSRQTGGIAFDSTQQAMYVLCHDESQLRRVDLSSGTSELLFSGGLLNRPYGLIRGQDGALYAANYSGASVLKVDVENNDVSILAEGLYGLPIAIAQDASGNIYVTANPRSHSAAAGVFLIRPDGTAERMLSDNLRFGIVFHRGEIMVGSSSNWIAPIHNDALNLSVLDNYLQALPGSIRYLLDTSTSSTHDNGRQATILMGLSEGKKYLEPGNLLAEVDTKIAEISERLRARQAPDGGWSLSGIATNDSRDPLITAMVGVAMEYTSPSPKDPMVRNAISYLLSSQKSNGAWGTRTGLFSTDLGTTSLVMVYMPKALDRIGGLDVALSLSMPSDVSLKNPSIEPTVITPHSNGALNYTWQLDGVTGKGRDIGFDLHIADLQLGENRSVAASADIAFGNSFTEEVIVRSIKVPAVAAASQLGLGVSTDKPTYLASEPVNITSLVKNFGPDFAGGAIKLSIRSGEGGILVADLGLVQQPALVANDDQSHLSNWNTGSTLVGSYQVAAELIDQGGRVVAQAVAPFSILATGSDGGTTHTGAFVYTDKPQYSRGETIVIDSKALNLTANQIQEPAYGKLIVKDFAGHIVMIKGYAIPQLMPTASYTFQVPLVLPSQQIGRHSVTWEVFNTAGVELLSSASAEFEVVADPFAALDGTVIVDKEMLYRGDTQICHFTASNVGDGSDVEFGLFTTLAHIPSQTVIKNTSERLALWAGEHKAAQQPIDTSGYQLGEYACVLQVQVGDVTRVLGTALFTLKEPPIKITGTLDVADRGRLLVLVDGTGSLGSSCKGLSQVDVTISADAILAPGDHVLAELLSDSGAILDAESVTISDYSPFIDTAGGQTVNLSFAKSTAEGVVVRLQSGQILKPLPQTALKLRVQLIHHDTVASYESDLFHPDCNLKVAQEVGPRMHVGLVVGEDVSEPYGPKDAPTRVQQRRFVEQLLAGAGWSYTLVDNSEDFAHELNNGGYAAVALFNEEVKLAETVQKELVAAVAHGTGLLYAGYHDKRNGRLESALGIRAGGKLPRITGVSLLESAIADTAEQLTFSFDAKPLAATLHGAQPLAYYRTNELAEEVAIAGYTHGSGYSVYVGFDLLGESASAGLNSGYAELLLASLEQVQPTVVAPFASGVLPMRISLTNEGIPVEGQVVLTLPAGANAVDAGVGKAIGSEIILPFILAEDESKAQVFWVRLPDDPQVLQFEATVFLKDSDGALIKHNSFDLELEVILP